MADSPTTEILRRARTHRNKVLRFVGETPDGEALEWYVAYRGEFGWSACRGTGEWMDEPSADDVEYALEEYDEVELIDRSETPKEVAL